MSGGGDPLQRALAEACFAEDATSIVGSDIGSFFEARGVAMDDVAAIRAQPGRVAVYRSLVRNGLSSVVLRALPRTRARMNRAADGRFDRDFASFVDRVGPRTHYLRDVPAEFLAWVEPIWRADPTLPPYLADLAVHEITAFSVSTAAGHVASAQPAEVALDRPLAFVPSATLTRYRWRVHRIAASTEVDDVPEAGEVALLAYRDAAHVVRWMELTPLAAAIVERLLAGATLGGAVGEACAALGAAAEPQAIADLLGGLADRGVVVGAYA
jgi:hypothetical protein